MKMINRHFSVKLAHTAFPYHKLESMDDDISIIKSEALPSSRIIRRILNLCLNETSLDYTIEGKQLKFLKPSELLYQQPELDKDLQRYANMLREAFTSLGAYTPSVGNNLIRDKIKEALIARDNVAANTDDVMLVNGLNEDLKFYFNAFIDGKSCGVLKPEPNNPFHDKYAQNANGTIIDFEFDWNNIYNTIENMQEAVDSAKRNHITPRILLISSPNNPTGKVFTADEIRMIIDFAYYNSIMIIVDESFQDVVLDNSEFVSFKKVLKSHPNVEIRDSVEMMSMYSISKGVFQEPGLRAAFIELSNIDQQVYEMFDKFLTMLLCPSTVAQIAVGLHFYFHRLNKELNPALNDFYMTEFNANKAIMKEKRTKLLTKLRNIPELDIYNSDGTYYTWCKLNFEDEFIAHNKMSLRQFTNLYANNISQQCGIKVFSGCLFSKPGYLRFSLMDKHDDTAYEKLLDFNWKIRINGFRA